MTPTLFSKAAVFSDIHYGMRNNSKLHNDDCSEYVSWFIETALDNNCETCIFMGDLSHHRNTVNIQTLNYIVKDIGRLSESFKTVYMIMGNHDLYYREKRELHSIPYANLFPNVVIINDDILLTGDVAFVPWLVEDEWKKIGDIDTKYIFGHFELPFFEMNAMVKMPDTGGLNATHFKYPDYVFSGHFHKRQNIGRVHYIGNPFPHNYADAWDEERGMMILEWGGKPEYLNWPNMPKFKTLTLSNLIKNPDFYLTEKSYCRVTVDVNLSYEEASYIKENLTEEYKMRELVFIQDSNIEDITSDEEIGSINDIDQVVIKQLQSLESDSIDNNFLVEIYRDLEQ